MTSRAEKLAAEINKASLDGILSEVLEEWRVLLRMEGSRESLKIKECVASFERDLERSA